MKYQLLIMLSTACLLAGCGSAELIDPQAVPGLVETITEDATGPLRPPPVQFLATWRANLMPDEVVCGFIDPPPALEDDKASMRFVYYPKQKAGQIERDEGWIIGSDAGQAIVAQNRVLFDQLWDRACAPDQPFRDKVRSTIGI